MTYSRLIIMAGCLCYIFACSNQTDEKPENPTLAKKQTLMTDTQDNITNNNLADNRISPPIAKKIDHIMKIHGHQRNDPYYWLRDDKREDKQMLAYLTAEQDYTKKKLAHTEALQKKLYQEMAGRLQPNEESIPVLYKGYWYFSKYEEGKDYAINLRRKDSKQAKDEVMLDQNKRAKDHDYYSLGGLATSPNQQLLAFSEDTLSRRQYDIRIKDLTSGKIYDDLIQGTSGSIVWANDNQTIFYIKNHPTTLLSYQVYRHKLGTSQQDDILVYEEKDNSFYMGIGKSRSEKYLMIYLSSTTNSEILLIDADKPESQLQMFLKREKDHKYSIDHIGSQFYIQSDLNAPNGQLLKVADNKIGSKQHWQTVLQHSDDRLLQGFELFNDYLVSSERVKGQVKIILRNFDGKAIDEIKFEQAAYSAGLGSNPDPASKLIRYAFSSLTTPNSVFEYDLQNKTSRLLKQDKVLGDFNPANYHSERIMIDARDGKQVPVSIVYRKDQFKKDGTNPLLNYAYGSYGSIIDATFSSSRLSLLDRGFVFAISHIRGGKMLGRQWYEDGKKLNKINTFNDYIDATRALIKAGYGDKHRIYAMGGSAGGLLMGAVVNMAPELYHGVIAAVPFVDVVTTMLDESIPLTTNEYDEWGNPNDKIFYDYMLSYSPYDQVKKQHYPNLLVVTGLHDSQVQYFEPAKWVAKLRDFKTDSNLLLLDIDMQAGHGGKSGRYKRFTDQAREYAFLLDLAGIKN